MNNFHYVHVFEGYVWCARRYTFFLYVATRTISISVYKKFPTRYFAKNKKIKLKLERLEEFFIVNFSLVVDNYFLFFYSFSSFLFDGNSLLYNDVYELLSFLLKFPCVFPMSKKYCIFISIWMANALLVCIWK